MRFACWITKATDTLRICHTFCFTTTKWLGERASIVHYTYTVSVVVIAKKLPSIFRYCTVYVHSVFAQSHTTTNVNLKVKEHYKSRNWTYLVIKYTLLVLCDVLLVNGAAF